MSARFDLALVAAPFAAALLALVVPSERARPLPLWAFLALVVAFDVAHVWATLYFSYLDPDVARRRRALLLLPLPLAFLVSYRLHAHSPVLFWTLLAYVAIHHFASQQYGFVALYKAKAGERDPVDRHLDRWTLWTGALGPVLLWHASPERAFDWFAGPEDFLFTLDPALRPDLVAVMSGVAAVYVARQAVHLRRGTFNRGKNVWMLATWLSWSLGIGIGEHPLVSLALVNLLHGIPFLGLVWVRCTARWDAREPERPTLVSWLSQRRRWPAFYGLLVLLALLEEGLWDRLVWLTYLPALLDVELPRTPPGETSFWVALLALPQVVHYFLDAWLWKLDGTNPDLHEALGLPRRAA